MCDNAALCEIVAGAFDIVIVLGARTAVDVIIILVDVTTVLVNAVGSF